MRQKRRSRSRSRRGLLLLLCAYALLSAAWVFSNPPYAAPDEWSHFVRAASIGNGQLIGDRVEGKVLSPAPPGPAGDGQRARERWASQNTRNVTVPKGRTPSWFSCSSDPLVPALCLTGQQQPSKPATWAVPTGNYQPFPYLIPALISRIDASPNSLARMMRTGKALLVLALLAIAFLVLWVPDQRGIWALGLVVAITPMVVFLAGSLNPNGLEIAGAIAFFACLLRLAREDGVTRWVWFALAAGGVVLALSRSTAPLWISLDLAVFFALAGARRGVRILRMGSPYSIAALACVALAVAANRLWESLYGPHIVVDATPVDQALRAGWLELPEIVRQQVGVFDYLEFGLPPAAYMLWIALTIGLFSIAQLLGNRRERLVLWATLAGVLLVPVLLVAAIMRHTGYGLQGRYVLAFSITLPLLAGEIVCRRRAALESLHVGAILLPFAMAAVVQVDALYANARRFAVGVAGPEWFVGSAVWDPPGGWLVWLAVAVVAATLLALAPVLDSPRAPGG